MFTRAVASIAAAAPRFGRRGVAASSLPRHAYRGFISYSHAVDGELAPAVQLALHRFARPWYRLRAIRVVPVITIDDPDDAVPLARALSDGGLACAEITFRTPRAAEALRRITAEVPEMFAGAGTVLAINKPANHIDSTPFSLSSVWAGCPCVRCRWRACCRRWPTCPSR